VGAGVGVGVVASAHVCASVRVGGRVHVGASSSSIVVHVSDVLTVAFGHLEDFGTDFDELAAPLLCGPAAALANRERDLVARTAWVLGTLENLAAEEQGGCVLIERLARVATNFRHRVAKHSENLAREVEAEDVALEARVRNVVGEASRTMTADELLDLTHGPPSGGFEPLLLGGGGRDASELSRVGKADGAGLEMASGFGQLFEGLGDAELLLSETRAVAEETLGVFVERRVAEAQMSSRAVRSKEPASLLEIETRALGGEADKLFMCLTPCGAVDPHDDC